MSISPDLSPALSLVHLSDGLANEKMKMEIVKSRHEHKVKMPSLGGVVRV
jgi:hypothetical protein